LNNIKGEKTPCKAAHTKNIIRKYFFLFSKINFIYKKDKKNIYRWIRKTLQYLNVKKILSFKRGSLNKMKNRRGY